MAYNPNNPARKILDLGISAGGSIYVYESTHINTVVSGANFFTGCAAGSPSSNCIGMRVGDIVCAICVATSGTSSLSWHRCISVSTSTGWGGGLHATVST